VRGESPHEPASPTAEWSAIHIARTAPRGGGALFDPAAAAGGKNNHRSASGVVNGEQKNPAQSQSSTTTRPRRELSIFIASMGCVGNHRALWQRPLQCPRARSSLNLDDHFALLAIGELFRRCHGLISG
jgi:hypothetical protein